MYCLLILNRPRPTRIKLSEEGYRSYYKILIKIKYRSKIRNAVGIKNCVNHKNNFSPKSN